MVTSSYDSMAKLNNPVDIEKEFLNANLVSRLDQLNKNWRKKLPQHLEVIRNLHEKLIHGEVTASSVRAFHYHIGLMAVHDVVGLSGAIEEMHERFNITMDMSATQEYIPFTDHFGNTRVLPDRKLHYVASVFAVPESMWMILDDKANIPVPNKGNDLKDRFKDANKDICDTLADIQKTFTKYKTGSIVLDRYLREIWNDRFASGFKLTIDLGKFDNLIK